jgi:hypothetical protein
MTSRTTRLLLTDGAEYCQRAVGHCSLLSYFSLVTASVYTATRTATSDLYFVFYVATVVFACLLSRQLGMGLRRLAFVSYCHSCRLYTATSLTPHHCVSHLSLHAVASPVLLWQQSNIIIGSNFCTCKGLVCLIIYRFELSKKSCVVLPAFTLNFNFYSQLNTGLARF